MTSEQSTELFKPLCAITPEYFQAVGQFYEDFSQTTDEEVRELVARARATELSSARPQFGAHLRHQIRYDVMRTTLITALTLAFALGSPVLAQKEESTTEKVKDAARALLGEKKEAQEQRAKVKITEGSLDMPNRFTAGEITFAVTNDADEKRGFQIAGKGIRESLGKIKPGETSTLTVKLEPGSYTASCPEHRGEQMTFKVTEE